MEGEMGNQPTAKDRLIDRRGVLRTGAALAPAPRLMAGRQRRLSAKSWSVPDACERAKDSRFRVTWRKVRMSSFAARILVSTLRSRLHAGGVVAGFLAVTLIPSFSAAAPAEDSIPQLGSRDFGWNVNFWDFQLDPPQGSAHGPIKTDPNPTFPTGRKKMSNINAGIA